MLTPCFLIAVNKHAVGSIEEKYLIVDGFKAIAVPGHTPDSMSLFDVKSSTLLSGDSLQLYGIYGSCEWGANIGLVKEHIEAPVVREQICKPQTLVEIRKMLTGVVTEGTAKNLMSPYVSIAGKTGTAQMSKGGAGYKSGETTHRVSFCGYFPDNESPKYSCIVVVTRPRGVYPSAGAISGEVVKTIAEHLYANGFLDKALQLEVDKDIVMAPEIKRGISNITQSLCDSLSVAYTTEAEDNSDIRISGEHIEVFNQDNDSIPLIPSVIGMGLKDALLVLEQSGVNVKIKGQGCVKEQMPDPGSKLGKGDEVIITLE